MNLILYNQREQLRGWNLHVKGGRYCLYPRGGWQTCWMKKQNFISFTNFCHFAFVKFVKFFPVYLLGHIWETKNEITFYTLYTHWKRQNGQAKWSGCPNNKNIMTMENQSGLKALTFHRQYLLSETTEMVWKINRLFPISGLSFPIFICTARANQTMWPLLQIRCDKMLIQAWRGGIFLLLEGDVCVPRAAYSTSSKL